jgi:methionyl-tRNA formyltransferase
LAFFGTGEFAVPALRAVAQDVIFVVTQPDRPSGRGMNPKPSPVKLEAARLNLSVVAPEKARAPEFVQELRNLGLDALIVASYGQILSQAVLDSAERGGINLHGSILPHYRGAAPIQRAILDGRRESGVTIMQMDKGMDTGPIIAIAKTPIDADETYGELQDRLAAIAADLLLQWLPVIEAGTHPRIPQDDARATMAPKVEKAEAELSWSRSAVKEYDRFRAFTPSPGPFLRLPSGQLKLRDIRPMADFGEPGTVLTLHPLPVIAFAEGSLELIEVQPEGKKRMSGRDWANGLRLRPGQSLTHE